MTTVLNTVPIVPKVLRTQGSGRKTSEVFTLCTEAEVISAAAWVTPASDGTSFQVVSEGFSKLLVWSITELADTESNVSYSIVGQRPFVSSSIKAATSAADSTYTAATLWLPCPILSPNTQGSDSLARGDTNTLSDRAIFPALASGGIICNGADVGITTGKISDVSRAGVLNATTTYAFPSVIVDCAGCEKITAYIHIAASNGGMILGQFIE